MNKKFLSQLGVIGLMSYSISLYAQNGKVGINTDKPTQTLDINGTTRVRELLTSETNSAGEKLQGFTYNVVATEDGTLAKQKMSRRKWNLYEADFNTRKDVSKELPAANQNTRFNTAAENTWEIPNSEVVLEIPNIENTKVLTKIQWNTWFEVLPRYLGDSITPENTDRGSFRFYLKYIEVDKDGAPIAGATPQYTSTIFMTTFANVNTETVGRFRIGAAPSYMEKDEKFFKKGKIYKISLTAAVEAMRQPKQGSQDGFSIINWGIESSGETFYQHQ